MYGLLRAAARWAMCKRGGAVKAARSEADFCARLRAWAEGRGFVVYPELDGWDLVLVAPHGGITGFGGTLYAGDQVGVQAKLRPSFEVLDQCAMPGGEAGPLDPTEGPAFRFVACPAPAGTAFLRICSRLNVGVILEEATFTVAHASRRERREPLALPPIASRSIAAGAPSPRQLSPWRVKALTFLAFARDTMGGENLTMAHLRAHGLNKSWAQEWMIPMGWTYGEREATSSQRSYTGHLRLQASGRAIEHRAGGRAVVKVRLYRLRADPEAMPDHGYEDVYAELAAARRPAPAEIPPLDLQPREP